MAEYVIETRDLSKIYSKTKVVNSIDMHVEKGKIYGLLGKNGAGKTTLMKSILGFINYNGQITLDGEPITRKNIAKLSFATSPF